MINSRIVELAGDLQRFANQLKPIKQVPAYSLGLGFKNQLAL
jgi:hypothetical protein